MDSLQKRIAAYADASANLLAQLNELDELRERVKKAVPFAHLRPKALKEKARQHEPGEP
jgi:hypothetical protein